jgi:hypothetical protein
MCYDVVSWDTMAKDLDAILEDFLISDSIKDYAALDAFNDVTSLLALTKGSLVKLLVLQQSVMLGKPGSLEDLKDFIILMGNKLEGRYNKLTSLENAKLVVNLISHGNSTHLGFNPCEQGRTTLYETEDVFADRNCNTAGGVVKETIDKVCDCADETGKMATGYIPCLRYSPYFPLLKCAFRDPLGVSVPFSEDSYPDVDASTFGIKGNLTLRMSCEDEPQVMTGLCTADQMTGNSNRENAFKNFQCGPTSKAIDPGLWDRYDNYSGSQRLLAMCYRRSVDRCWSGFLDLLNPGGSCNKVLMDYQTQAVNDYAQKLVDKKKETLAPVKQVIDDYKSMVAIGGMDPSYLNAFTKFGYPDEECFSPPVSSEAASIIDAIEEEEEGGGSVEAVAESSAADLPLFWGVKLLNGCVAAGLFFALL